MQNWNLFTEVNSLKHELDRMFHETNIWRKPFSQTSFLPGNSTRQYPMFNLSETENDFYVEALAPGIDADKLEMSVTGNTLTVSGRKIASSEQVDNDAFHRNERATGKFMRMIELPSQVNSGKIKATYKSGLLMITLPKAEEVKPKQITISEG